MVVEEPGRPLAQRDLAEPRSLCWPSSVAKTPSLPPVEGLTIFNAALGPKQLLYVPAAGHVREYYVATRLYEATVLAFLAANLRSEESSVACRGDGVGLQQGGFGFNSLDVCVEDA